MGRHSARLRQRPVPKRCDCRASGEWKDCWNFTSRVFSAVTLRFATGSFFIDWLVECRKRKIQYSWRGEGVCVRQKSTASKRFVEGIFSSSAPECDLAILSRLEEAAAIV